MSEPALAQALVWAASPEAGSAEPEFFESILNLPGWAARTRSALTRPLVTARVADDPTLSGAADTLVAQRYAWRGYRSDPDAGEEREASETVKLVALESDHVAGTMTLGLDGPHGLWIDQAYPEVTHRMRLSGCKLCELTRLAVAPRMDTRQVLSALFCLAYRIGRLTHGTTDLYVEVNPRHAPLYCRLFGFAAASGIRECGRVKAPAILLHLDIAHLDEARARHFADRARTLPELTS